VSIFDAMAARDAAMAQVHANANLAWLIAAYTAAHRTALALPFFTSDDVNERIDPSARTHEPRALGPVMKQAAKNGWIEKAPQPGKSSRRRSLHASPRTVWKSLIYLSPEFTGVSPVTPDTEGPDTMTVEITIRANSLQELWNQLSAFSHNAQAIAAMEIHPKAIHDKAVNKIPDSVSGNGADVAPEPDLEASSSTSPQSMPSTLTAPAKRGPGRPPKPKLVEPAPEPDADEDEGETEEQTRHKLTQEITKHWREDIPAKKKLIREFRTNIGIGAMVDMKPEHFPKARALLLELEVTAP